MSWAFIFHTQPYLYSSCHLLYPGSAVISPDGLFVLTQGGWLVCPAGWSFVPSLLEFQGLFFRDSIKSSLSAQLQEGSQLWDLIHHESLRSLLLQGSDLPSFCVASFSPSAMSTTHRKEEDRETCFSEDVVGDCPGLCWQPWFRGWAGTIWLYLCICPVLLFSASVWGLSHRLLFPYLVITAELLGLLPLLLLPIWFLSGNE